MKLNDACKPLLACVLVAAVVTGCSSGILRGPSYSNAPVPSASDELTTLYLIRKSSTIYNYPINRLSVNGQQVVALTDQEFTWLQLPAGRHRVEERGNKTQHDIFLALNAGETHYVLFDFEVDGLQETYGENTTLTGARISFSEVDEVTALNALKRSNYKEPDAAAVSLAASSTQPAEVTVERSTGIAPLSSPTPSEAPPPVTGPATSTGAAAAVAAGTSPDPRHYITALHYVARGKEAEFQEYERQISVLMAAYGGRIEHAIAPETIQGNMNPPNVVHLQVFESSVGYDRFRADARWKELEQMRADATTDSIILRGRRLVVDPGAG